MDQVGGGGGGGGKRGWETLAPFAKSTDVNSKPMSPPKSPINQGFSKHQ